MSIELHRFISSTENLLLINVLVYHLMTNSTFVTSPFKHPGKITHLKSTLIFQHYTYYHHSNQSLCFYTLSLLAGSFFGLVTIRKVISFKVIICKVLKVRTAHFGGILFSNNLVLKENDKILTGTGCIILAAPSHYDYRKPIDIHFSNIDQRSKMFKAASKHLDQVSFFLGVDQSHQYVRSFKSCNLVEKRFGDLFS